MQPFRRSVYGRAQPRRARAVNRQIVGLPGWTGKPAELLGDLPDGGTFEPGSVVEDADRQAGVGKMLHVREILRFLIAAQFDPFEWYVAAMQEVTYRVAFSAAHASIDPDHELVRL